MAETILDTIVADTKRLVEKRRREVTIRHLEDRPLYHRKALDMASALGGNRLSIIAEIKKASPSRGLIRESFDVAELATSYEQAEADAISVLTEPGYFQGHLRDLESARRAVSVPILRKDFITDTYQIVEARSFGADAILLIAAVLDRHHLTDLLQAAHALGLSALVELYDVRELDRIDFDLATMVGVNNRNLHTFEVDPDHARAVLAHVPRHIIRVAESGMKTGTVLANVWRNDIDAVLIGETFMVEEDPGEALRAIRKDCDSLLNQTAS